LNSIPEDEALDAVMTGAICHLLRPLPKPRKPFMAPGMFDGLWLLKVACRWAFAADVAWLGEAVLFMFGFSM